MKNEALLQDNEPKTTLSMNPLKFAMWLFILSVVMIFASMTSAYLVSQAERMSRGAWLQFELPSTFWYTSAIILVSSITMHWAFISAKKDEFKQLKTAVVLTSILGLLFLIGQIVAWNQMTNINVFFAGKQSNPAGSYVYVFSGLHGLHILAGVILLIVLFIRTFQGRVHSKNMLTMEIASTFWHFLDGLWLYVFFFLLFTRI